MYGLDVSISSPKLDDDIYGSFSAAYLHNQSAGEKKVVIATLPASINTFAFFLLRIIKKNTKQILS